MKKYKYIKFFEDDVHKTVNTEKYYNKIIDIDSSLDKIGNDGWELINVVYNPSYNGNIYYFKKEIPKNTYTRLQ